MFGTEIVAVNGFGKPRRTLPGSTRAGVDGGLGEPDGIGGADVHPDAFKAEPMQPAGFGGAVLLLPVFSALFGLRSRARC